MKQRRENLRYLPESPFPPRLQVLEAGLDAEHAERMDRMYRYQRHIYDLTRKYYLLGRDRLIDELQPPVGGHVLEVGCGTGRLAHLAHGASGWRARVRGATSPLPGLSACRRCWPG